MRENQKACTKPVKHLPLVINEYFSLPEGLIEKNFTGFGSACTQHLDSFPQCISPPKRKCTVLNSMPRNSILLIFTREHEERGYHLQEQKAQSPLNQKRIKCAHFEIPTSFRSPALGDHVIGSCCHVVWVIRRQLTRGRHHALPFLEEGRLQTVAGVQAIGLVPWHELLHGLQNHAQLKPE